MKLTKAKEILEFNLTEAGDGMPPDVQDALKLHIGAVSQLIRFRKGNIVDFTQPLKGETPPREGGD